MAHSRAEVLCIFGRGMGKTAGSRSGRCERCRRMAGENGTVSRLFLPVRSDHPKPDLDPGGMAKMELLPFLLLTTAGSLIWNTVLIGAGAVAGASWERILVLLKTYSRFAVMGAGILGFAVACVYFRKR